MTSSITLWWSPGACSLAVHILLLEAGLKFSLAKVEARNGIPEEFRAVNPKMKVPVLILDGEAITEVPAIMTAISQLTPGRNFLGNRDLELVRAYEWMNWLSGTLHGQGYGMLFRPGRFIDDERLFEVVQEKGKGTIKQCYEHIELALQNDHAVGDKFTAVDAYIYVFYRWGIEQLGEVAMHAYPKFGKLANKLLQRQSFISALEREGLMKVDR